MAKSKCSASQGPMLPQRITRVLQIQKKGRRPPGSPPSMIPPCWPESIEQGRPWKGKDSASQTCHGSSPHLDKLVWAIRLCFNRVALGIQIWRGRNRVLTHWGWARPSRLGSLRVVFGSQVPTEQGWGLGGQEGEWALTLLGEIIKKPEQNGEWEL